MEQNGILIRNNNLDRPRCSLNVLTVHGRRHEGRSRGKKCQQTQPNLRPENAERSRPRSPRPALTPAAFHHQRNYKTACSSTIALSFPFPFPVVCPPPPPSEHAPAAKPDTVCSRGGKVLTHSTKASPSCCVGTVAPQRVAPGAKSTGIRPFNFTPVLSLN